MEEVIVHSGASASLPVEGGHTVVLKGLAEHLKITADLECNCVITPDRANRIYPAILKALEAQQ